MTSRMQRTSLPIHVKFIKENLPLLELILYDFELILANISSQLSDREYQRIQQKGEMSTLLHQLIKKGKTACQAFVSLLRDNAEVKETFPRLVELDLPRDSPQVAAPLQPQRAQGRQAQRSQPARRGQTKKSKGKTFNLEGKVMTVSKLMKKKVHFFRTNFKTNFKTWEVLVFNTGLREQFVTAKKNKSPVVLQRLQDGLQGNALFKDSSEFKVACAQTHSGGESTTSPPGGPPPAPEPAQGGSGQPGDGWL